MKNILLIGAVMNFAGCCGMLISMRLRMPFSFPVLPQSKDINPPDYVLHRLFSAGTVLTFGIMFGYLYYHPEYVKPFLIFGMALKYWVFAASLISYLKYNMPKDVLFCFGVPSLAMAVLFSYYLIALWSGSCHPLKQTMQQFSLNANEEQIYWAWFRDWGYLCDPVRYTYCQKIPSKFTHYKTKQFSNSLSESWPPAVWWRSGRRPRSAAADLNILKMR